MAARNYSASAAAVVVELVGTGGVVVDVGIADFDNHANDRAAKSLRSSASHKLENVADDGVRCYRSERSPTADSRIVGAVELACTARVDVAQVPLREFRV